MNHFIDHRKDLFIDSSIPRSTNLEFPLIQLNGGYTNTKLDIYECVNLITDRNTPICCMVETPSKKKANEILCELKRQTEREFDMICEKVGYEYITLFVDKSIFDIDENYNVNYNGRFIETGITNVDTGDHIRIIETHFPRGRKNQAVSSIKGRLGNDCLFTGDFNCNPNKLKNDLVPLIINLALDNSENPTTPKGKHAIDNIGSLKMDHGRTFCFNDVEIDKSAIKSTDHYPVIANVCSYVR